MTLAPQDVFHEVLFAEGDDELAGVAGERLADALQTGHAAIVIATPEHQRGFTDRIRAAGLDPAGAQADGTLLLLDAAETLDLLRPAGAFDRGAFDDVVGALVRGMVERGPVFAFGEMVALLFEAGVVQEAIELEAAWDDLVEETSVRLLCAYPGVLLDNPGQAVHVGSVCSMHSAVVAHTDFHRSWAFADDRAAGSMARRLVANALRARGVPETAFYDTLSVVTELVANAVAQGGAPVSVEMSIDDALVSVRVGDGSSVAPALRAAGREKVSRGLHVVEELAHRWGVDFLGGGKVVWAELAR